MLAAAALNFLLDKATLLQYLGTAEIGGLVHLQNYDLTAKPVKPKRKSTFQHKFHFRNVK